MWCTSKNILPLQLSESPFGLEPYGNFKDMLKGFPYAETVEDLEKLLPWNFKCKDVKAP